MTGIDHKPRVRPSASGFTCVITTLQSSYIISISQMKKLALTGVQRLTQGQQLVSDRARTRGQDPSEMDTSVEMTNASPALKCTATPLPRTLL